MTVHPRRSVLYMPGSNARALEKAKTLAADGVILDLEDSVAPEAKESARRQVAEAVKAGGFGARQVFIRVNGIDTPWHVEDLAAAAQAAPDAILVPKVSNPETLELVGRRLLDMHIDHKTRVWAMIETPLAIFNILAIAAAARDSESRLAGFVMGTNDLAKDTRARLVPGRAPMLPWLTLCVAAARIHGIEILDGVYNDIGNAQGFAAECAQGRRARLRRQDADPSEPDRALQQGVLAVGGRGGGRAQDDRCLRPAGEQKQRRGVDRRPHGRAAARRHGAPHGRDRGGDRGALRRCRRRKPAWHSRRYFFIRQNEGARHAGNPAKQQGRHPDHDG